MLLVGIADAVFMSLESLGKLRSLRVCAKHVSCNSVYTSLSHLKQLSYLKISGASSLGGLLRPLRHCSSLSVLHAQRCVCRTLSHGALAGLTQLSELHVDLAATSQDALSAIAYQLPALSHLRCLEAAVNRSARTQDWAPALHSLAPIALLALPTLTALELPPCPGSMLPSLADALCALPALRQLSLLRRNRELPLPQTQLTAEPHALQEFAAAVGALRSLQLLELPFATLKACSSAATVALAPLVSLTSCLLYTSPSPRDRQKSRMPSSA